MRRQSQVQRLYLAEQKVFISLREMSTEFVTRKEHNDISRSEMNTFEQSHCDVPTQLMQAARRAFAGTARAAQYVYCGSPMRNVKTASGS